ncbi:peptidoglycan-binding domain-containing protein [Tardiphaga sp. OK245]|uniref:peptidoglycan-binding domain-containing protein n=1 Tax=Tardiphaga sp. OK245 TaxID=1855306 RepID=UPI00147C5232|nr:peptidoglycan-binding domain-containing protein [Tardiphaga sp. OK245]
MVMRVQLELKTRGFYNGPVDGKLTQDVRDALRGFQIVNKLPDTGTMDNSTLAKLGIVY